jgi:hypothetical protein
MFRLITKSGDELPLTASSPNVEQIKSDGTIASDSTPPVLSYPVVALNSGLVCTPVPGRPSSEERACVTPFVWQSESQAIYDAGWFTFVTGNNEPVHASAPGVVADVTYIEHSMLTHSDLFSIAIRSNDDSAFWMEYRNVKNLKVTEGQMISAGEELGGAGDYFDAKVGLVAFGVRRQQELNQRICPLRFATSELADTYASALGTSNTAWPETSHSSLCSETSLMCVGPACQSPSDFQPVAGDIDEGRRIYKHSCAVCHGDKGEGGIGSVLCFGANCSCTSCSDHNTLAARIEKDMPPEGYCDARCAADVAAFVAHELTVP